MSDETTCTCSENFIDPYCEELSFEEKFEMIRGIDYAVTIEIAGLIASLTGQTIQEGYREFVPFFNMLTDDFSPDAIGDVALSCVYTLRLFAVTSGATIEEYIDDLIKQFRLEK